MPTLQEFLIYTKGWEYLITILFVFAFVAFWELTNRKGAPR